MIQEGSFDNVCFCRHLLGILVGDNRYAKCIISTDEERHGNVSDLRHIDWLGISILIRPALLKLIELPKNAVLPPMLLGLDRDGLIKKYISVGIDHTDERVVDLTDFFQIFYPVWSSDHIDFKITE